MAERRMFSLGVADTDSFLALPFSAQTLYLHLSMRADDDGFLANAKSIAKMIGCKTSDLGILEKGGWVISFPSGVFAITHWKVNNYIQKDRYKPTRYQDELRQLAVEDDKAYRLMEEGEKALPESAETEENTVDTECIQAPEAENDTVDTGCIQSVSSLYPQVRIGKDSIGEEEKKGVLRTPKEDEEDSQAPIFTKILLQNGKWGDIPEAYVSEAEGVYSGVDVREEIRKACMWCQANPKQRKKDWQRFITNWLSRASSEAKARTGTATVGYGQTVHCDRIPSGRYDDVEDIDFSGGDS